MAIWEDERPLPRRRPSWRMRRWARRLSPPADGAAAEAWGRFGPDEQQELFEDAAAGRWSADPSSAAVLAALQRQLEARAGRGGPAVVALAAVAFVALGLVGTDAATPSAMGAVLGATAGLSLQVAPITRARRRNETVARAGGRDVPAGGEGRLLGLDRPVVGDPLLPLVVLAGEVLAVWWAAWLELSALVLVPVAVPCAGVLLGTARAFVRGSRHR